MLIDVDVAGGYPPILESKTMLNEKRHLLTISAYALSAAVFAFLPTSAAADTVTLEAHDGTISITGPLLSYVDGIHTIDSDLGPIWIPANFVECHGAACPSRDQIAADIELSIHYRGDH